MARTGTRQARDPSTRTARVIRRTAVRYFALASAGWVLFAPTASYMAGAPLALTVAITAASVGMLIAVVGYGLNLLLNQVERLDHERHGLREAYDRARLDSLRDGLTGPRQPPCLPGGAGRADHGRPRAQPAVRAAVRRPRRPQEDQRRARSRGRRPAPAGDRGDHQRQPAPLGPRVPDRRRRVRGRPHRLRRRAAVTTAKRMLATALDGGAGEHATEPFSLTIGVSAFPRPASERQQLVHQADAALYWGKRHGRTDVQLFDPSRHGIAEDSRPLDEIAAAVSRVAAERLLTPGLPADLQPAHGRGAGLRGARPPAARGRLPEPERDVRRRRVDRADGRARPCQPRDGHRRRERARRAAVPVGEPVAAIARDRRLQPVRAARALPPPRDRARSGSWWSSRSARRSRTWAASATPSRACAATGCARRPTTSGRATPGCAS